MAYEEIERLLGVKWYDGLLIRSDHLVHADERAVSLFSRLGFFAFDQPGLVFIEPVSAPSQLVSLGGFRRKAEDEGAELRLDVLSAFVSLAPDGSPIIGVPNQKGLHGLPLTTIKVDLAAASGDRRNYLVCVCQEANDDLAVRKTPTPDQTIELAYPGLKVELTAPERYAAHLATEYKRHTPIALVAIQGDKAEIDTSYIPPVITLRYVDFFDPSAIDLLAKMLGELCAVSSQYLAAGGYLFSTEGIGVELRARYNYYHVLNAMLLTKAGALKDLRQMSPIALFREIMYPLAAWFDQYFERTVERRASLAPASALSAALRGLTQQEILSGTDKLVSLSTRFVSGIIDTIKEIA